MFAFVIVYFGKYLKELIFVFFVDNNFKYIHQISLSHALLIHIMDLTILIRRVIERKWLPSLIEI